MEYVRMETQHVAGLHGRSGDPSPVTAYGVYVGLKASARVRWGSDSLAGKKLLVQGCGNVARSLCDLLHQEGAKLVITDIDADKVKRVVQATGAEAVAPDAIYDVPADIYSPNALGATVNDDTLKRLKVEIIAGGANNQLAEERHGDELERRGMLYAPDYVINGGGVINVYGELMGWDLDRAKRKAAQIYDTLLNIFALARSQKIPSYRAADQVAESRIKAMGNLGGIRV
jgi:leucine dehydrogenase